MVAASFSRPPVPCIALLMLLVSIVSTSGIPSASADEGRAFQGPVINELLYDPVGADNSGEFVEIFNQASTFVSIEGWDLSDQDGTGPDIIFSKISMPAGSYLVVHTGTGTNDTDLYDGKGQIFLGKDLGIWSNNGDDCVLRNSTGAVVDYMAYGSGESVDPPPGATPWSGAVSLVPEGYSIGRMPDGTGGAIPSAYKAILPTAGSANILDLVPEISDWGFTPEKPEAFQDLDVWAKVTDQVEVAKVNLSLKASDGTIWAQEMGWSSEKAIWGAKVEGRPGGENISITINAQDPLGQTNVSVPRIVYFKVNASSQLTADLRGPQGAVIPGEYFQVSGRVFWANGSKVKGLATGKIPATYGEWSSNFTDYVKLVMQAPSVEGEYEVDVVVTSNEAKLTAAFTVVVEWPHKSLTCSIERDINLTRDDIILTDDVIEFIGHGRFTDGLPAANASAILTINGTGKVVGTRTDPSGDAIFYVKAPGIAGTYTVVFEVRAIGQVSTSKTSITVVDHLKLTTNEILKMPLTEGDNVTVAGHLSHHNGTPASGAIIVIEFLNTSHKARAITDADGNFSAVIVAPYYEGQYVLRETAVSGDAVASKTVPILVDAKEPGGKVAPGFELLVVVVALAFAFWRRCRTTS